MLAIKMKFPFAHDTFDPFESLYLRNILVPEGEV